MFRPIYEPRTRAREYSDLAINIYNGCNHGCKYCFAKRMHDRYKPNEDFANVKPRDRIVEAVRNQLSGGKYKGKKIMLCFTCDPYPADIDTTPTREIIKLIKEAGANVSALTKGGMRAVRDFDLYGPGDSFGCTLTFIPFNQYERYWESGAACTEERFAALQSAHDRGIKTWVSLEPVIYTEDTLEIIEYTHSCVDLFKVGKLNYDKHADLIDWKKFGHEAEALLKKYEKEYYIKEDLRKEMGE